MKYKVGDRVKVRSDLKNGERYYDDTVDVHDSFVGTMKELLGKIVTIKAICNDKYTLKEDPNKWVWTDEMFEGLAEGGMEVKEYKKGDTVIPFDGSWVVGIVDGKFGNRWGTQIKDRQFKVIATGLIVPAIEFGKLTMDKTFQGTPVVNDLCLQAFDNGEYIFIRSEQVKLIPRFVSFMEAIKAYSEGKKIRCKLKDGRGYEYIPEERCDFGYVLKAHSACAISSGEILTGAWYICD